MRDIGEAVGKLEASITAKEEALESNRATLNEKEEKFKEHTDNLTITTKALEDLKKKRSELFGAKSADAVSVAMDKAIKETARRRKIQEKYNEDNNIIPTTIIKNIKDVPTLDAKSYCN